MQIMASGLDKEASSNSLKRWLAQEVWKPTSNLPPSSTAAAPECDYPVYLLRIPSGVSSSVPWLSCQRSLQTSDTGGLRGPTSLRRAAGKGLCPVGIGFSDQPWKWMTEGKQTTASRRRM